MSLPWVVLDVKPSGNYDTFMARLVRFLLPTVGLLSLCCLVSAQAGDLPACTDSLAWREQVRCNLWRLCGLMRPLDPAGGRADTGPIILGPDRWAQAETKTYGRIAAWPDSIKISFYRRQGTQSRLTDEIRDNNLDGLDPEDADDAYLRYPRQEETINLLHGLDPNLIPPLNQEYLARIKELIANLESKPRIIGPVYWQSVAPGLELAQVTVFRYIRMGDSTIYFLRCDPRLYSLVPWHYQELEDKKLHDIEGWAGKIPTSVAIFNAGLYFPDKRYIGLFLKNGQDRGSGLHSTWKALLVSGGPGDNAQVPATTILDLQSQSFSVENNLYRYAAQSFMLLEANGFPRVRQTDSLASRTAVAMDDQGRVIVIHVPGACTLYELAELLKASGLQIRQTMSMDGGFQAQLLVQTAPKPRAFYGAWVVTERNQYYEPTFKLPIPAVIAVIPRTADNH